MRLRAPACLLACVWLAGCGEIPELPGGGAPDYSNSDYPALIPLDDTYLPASPDETEAAAQTLAREADALQARADDLRRRDPSGEADDDGA